MILVVLHVVVVVVVVVVLRHSCKLLLNTSLLFPSNRPIPSEKEIEVCTVCLLHVIWSPRDIEQMKEDS